MKAVEIAELGGPEVLHQVELPRPEPRRGEILVRLRAIGVNFVDTQQRRGFPAWYRQPLPFVPGFEGAGEVAALGEGVDAFAPGDRIAYTGPFGAYAEYAAVPAALAVALPAAIADDIGAAAMVQGITAHYLVHDCGRVGAGDWVLVHAGAGGTGGLLVQMAKASGAVVVATASSVEKRAAARELGADHMVDASREDWAGAVRAIAGFPGFAAVYDSIGQATFEAGLALLRRRGAMVVFGAASGPVPPFDINRLNPMGSLVLMRPNIRDFIASRAELLARANAVFAAILGGALKVRIGGRFPLAEAAAAHAALEGRQSLGKLILQP